MKKYIFSFLSGTTALWLLFSSSGCGKSDTAKARSQIVQTIPVKTMKVTLNDLIKTLDYADSIEAQDQAEVFPKVSGKIIEKLKEDGSTVAKGDVIAYIDRDEVGLKFEKAPVESPLTGIIGRVHVDIGTSVTPQTPIALVIDIDKVIIALDIPEKYLPLINISQEAQINVDAYPGETFIGKVKKISPVVDLDTRTFPIELEIENTDHCLKPGMFARVRLIMEQHKKAAVVVKEAIMGKDPNLYVYIVENGKAVLKHVKLGVHEDTLFEITDGLKENDEVVVMGQQRLKDGIDVSVETEMK